MMHPAVSDLGLHSLLRLLCLSVLDIVHALFLKLQ